MVQWSRDESMTQRGKVNKVKESVTKARAGINTQRLKREAKRVRYARRSHYVHVAMIAARLAS